MSAPTVKSVGADALIYMAGRAIPAVVQILTVTVLTAFFAPEEFARFELTFRFILFLSTFTFLWLNMAIVRFYAASAAKGTEEAFFGVIGALKLGALLAGLILGGLIYAFGPDALFGSYRDLLPAGILVFAGYTFYETGLTVLRAKRKPVVYSVAASVNALFRLPVAVALFLWWKTGVSGMLWSSAIMYALVYLLIVRRYAGAPRFRWGVSERSMTGGILLYGLPIWLAQLLNFFLNNSDQYLLKLLRDDTAVGLYGVAVKLVDQPMVLVFQVLSMAVFPSVALAWEHQGRAHTEDLVGGVTRLFLMVCVPLMVFLSVLAEPVFGLLARGDAGQAYIVAPWVAAASLMYGLTYFANYGLHLSKKTSILLLVTVLAVALNIGLNFLFIPRFGYPGAGMARLLSNTLLVILLAATSHRYLHWRFPWKSVMRIIAAALISGLCLYALMHFFPSGVIGLTALFILGGALYTALLLIFGDITPDQIRGFHDDITAFIRQKKKTS